jgi:Ni/Fe-hydrogenase subunit HybB-like protein
LVTDPPSHTKNTCKNPEKQRNTTIHQVLNAQTILLHFLTIQVGLKFHAKIHKHCLNIALRHVSSNFATIHSQIAFVGGKTQVKYSKTQTAHT